MRAIPAAKPAPPFQPLTQRHLGHIPQLANLSKEHLFAMKVVGQVLPFRVNRYVIEELIDWDAAPDDPIFQLTFPQPGMLEPAAFSRMADLLRANAAPEKIAALANEIRMTLNPHPADQQTLNIPRVDGVRLPGIQHKYRETVLFFPSQGQTCHAHCTFCFRWPQFVGVKDLRFASHDAMGLQRYLLNHREVSDVLLTGGDPMTMSSERLAAYIRPLLSPAFEHLDTIRIGSKALAYWPQRFTTDPDASRMLRLFEAVTHAGKHLALMAHYNHWRELTPAPAREAIRRVLDSGAAIRTQSPVVAHINADPAIWARMWRTQVRLGMAPYYMFVARNTGARRYFEVPLAQTVEIYRTAYRRLSGLARTARGPSMSAGPGKVEIQGSANIRGENVFVLRFIQGRNPAWVQHPFFARFDPTATWLDDLRPAFGEPAFFFEAEYREMRRRAAETAKRDGVGEAL